MALVFVKTNAHTEELNKQTFHFIPGIKNCEGIAIDWMGRNIYWTDETQKTISVAKMDDPSVQRVLIWKDMSHPRAIVIDPRPGKGSVAWCLFAHVIIAMGICHRF